MKLFLCVDLVTIFTIAAADVEPGNKLRCQFFRPILSIIFFSLAANARESKLMKMEDDFNQAFLRTENNVSSKIITPENAPTGKGAHLLQAQHPYDPQSPYQKYPGLSKLFPSIFTLVKFVNDDCPANNNLTGTCMTQAECFIRGGHTHGKCANNYGVCCTYTRTCGEIAYQNNTYFVNPNFPNPYNLNASSQTVQCDLRVYKSRWDVCQLRLDLDYFDLAGSPDCQLDRFTVPSPGSPVICGRNTRQHLYVDFPSGTDHVTLPMTLASQVMDRQFAIRVSQVVCGSLKQAPSGCLQYYTDRAGTIQSFNYGDPLNSPSDGNSGYPPNANYGICIRKDKDFCSIRYSRGGPFMVGTTITDGSDGLQTGSACVDILLNPIPGRGDYVIIPNSGRSIAPNVPTADRYCGTNFETVESRTSPYIVGFISDSNNNGEGGFRLNYEQLPC